MHSRSNSWYHVVALVVLLAIAARGADGFLTALEPGKNIALSPRSNPSATFPTSPSRFAERKQQSKGESVVAEYNDDAFGLVFLSASFVARDVVFAAIFVLISTVSTIAVRQKMIPFSKKLPALVAGMSLGLSILLNELLSSPESLASNEGILFDWLADKSATAIQVELASCSVSVIYAFVVSPLLQKDDRS